MAVGNVTKPLKIRIYSIILLVCGVMVLIHSVYFSYTPQIDMRVIVTALGVDAKEDGRVVATAHILVPVSANEKTSSQDTIEAEGASLMEALDNFNVTNGTRVETSQCGMVIFGKSICEKDIVMPVKSLISSGKISGGTLLVSSDNLEAKEFLKKYSQISEESSTGISNFVSFFENSLYMPTLNISKILSQCINESHSSYIPCIELKDNAPQESQSSGGGGGGGGSGGAENSKVSKTKIETISRIVIIKNGKRAGVLGQAETQGLAWLEGRSKRGFIQVERVKFDEKEFHNVNGEVEYKKTDIEYDFKDGMPRVKFKIRAQIDLNDRHMFSSDIDKGHILPLEQTQILDMAICDKIRSDVGAAVDAAKRMDSDFLSLKYYFYRLKNKQMREYESDPNNDFLKELQVEYDIKCDVR